MANIVIRLDPRLLDNPDADIRYRLPDRLTERSNGLIRDNGYDYVGNAPLMLLFLEVTDVKPALLCIIDVIENVRVYENDLRNGAVVAIDRDGDHEVVYPAGFAGAFLPTAE